jgi:hypothetical protein
LEILTPMKVRVFGHHGLDEVDYGTAYYALPGTGLSPLLRLTDWFCR